MITRKVLTRTRSVAGLQIAHHPARAANLVWLVILALAVVGGSLTLSCITPFAALAVALAGTVRLRAALSTMTAIWLTNQIVGFVLLGFPRTTSTFLWGFAIGAAAVLSTLLASAVIKIAAAWTAPARLCLALLLSFAVYEIALLVVAFFLGGLETFAPTIVAQLAFNNILWLAVITALNEVAAAMCRPWLGVTPRLTRAS